MYRALIMSLALLIFASCGDNAPAPTRHQHAPYGVLSEVVSPATGTDTVNISINGPLDEPSVKAIAESVIADRRNKFNNITVNSFASATAVNDIPFAISTLQGGEITHRFNPQAGSQKIPTH